MARTTGPDEADPHDWRQDAEALWGPNYQTPLAEVAGVNLRTIQRAEAPGGRLPTGIVLWLTETMRLVPPELRRAYGMALRAGRLSPEAADGARAIELALHDLRHRLP